MAKHDGTGTDKKTSLKDHLSGVEIQQLIEMNVVNGPSAVNNSIAYLEAQGGPDFGVDEIHEHLTVGPPPVEPDQGLPEGPDTPDNELPEPPARPSHGLPTPPSTATPHKKK